MTEADSFWKKFLEESGRADGKCAGDIYFSSDGGADAAGLSLICAGRKTASFSPLATFEADNEPLPKKGGLYLLFDDGGTPRCVIEIEGVAVVPFNEVTWEMARLEGEAYGLDDWRGRLSESLSDEAADVGFSPGEDTPLVFQTFRIVYPQPSKR